MEHWIKELEINNFKSIQHLKMDCKRINVLIGKPNVGKSNILEALALYTVPYSDTTKNMLEDYIRYEKLTNLFYDQDRTKQILIKSNLGFVTLRFHLNNINAYDIFLAEDISVYEKMKDPELTAINLTQMAVLFNNIVFENQQKSQIIEPFYGYIYDNEKLQFPNGSFLGYNSPFKQYHFTPLKRHPNHFPLFLRPPFGDNLYTLLESNTALYEEFILFFNQYDLDLVFDIADEKLVVQKKVGKRVYNTPYFLSADTLQRIIFHITAIETNENSILMFEEPESHSFPPYIYQLSEKIIESKTNQFFIVTHSPYILKPFIEQCDEDEVAIFIADYKEHETIIRKLRKEEIQNIVDTNIDLFFNIDAFQE